MSESTALDIGVGCLFFLVLLVLGVAFVGCIVYVVVVWLFGAKLSFLACCGIGLILAPLFSLVRR